MALSGDSCSFGWGVDTPYTFAARLETRALESGRALEVLNAAFPGESAVSGRYALRERVLPLRPQLVAIGFSANNAFRWASAADADRYRLFALRRLAVRSRLVQVAATALFGRAENPREPETYAGRPLERWRRIAFPEQYEAALRDMVRETRAAGARPLFLLLPRASQVSDRWRFEDSAHSFREHGLAPRTADLTDEESRLLQYSCLDHRSLDDPVATLRERVASWQPLFPAGRAELLEALRRGARLVWRDRHPEAASAFRQAVRLAPDSPLAHYDLGSALIDAGRTEAGLAALECADALACNVFLQYQVILRRVAVDLGVPVVDLLLLLQARPAGALFLDPAHPGRGAQQLIARALWRALEAESPAGS